MTTDLHELLADLAASTPPASPPSDLWDRGVRRRHWAVVGRAAVATILVLLVGLGGWTWHAARPVQPTDPHGSPELPDHLFRPSPWLRSFDGPPGQLVALVSTERKSLLHTGSGVVGVTASSGQYGFLDLPSDAVTDVEGTRSTPVLSPDGHHIAFWTTGTPSGTANTKLLGVTITGVAVYDTVTGTVTSARLSTEHGLAPTLLTWTDDHTVVLAPDQTDEGDENPNSCCDSHWTGLATWDIEGASGPTMLSAKLPIFVDESSTVAGQSDLVWSDSRRLAVIDPEPPGSDRVVRLSHRSIFALTSPDQTRVAVTGRRYGRIRLGTLPDAVGAGVVRLSPISVDAGFTRPIAWLDDDHLVAEHRTLGRARARYSLDVVDVRTGKSHVLVRAAASGDQFDPSGADYARDLLGAPVVHAAAPPQPWDRRTLSISLAVGIALLVLVLWAASRDRRA